MAEWLERAAKWLWPVAGSVLTVALYVSAFPGADLPESAYLFAIPFCLWFLREPRWRLTVLVVGLSGWVTWGALLWWLRHVTLFGALGLALVVSLFWTAWFLAARWALPRAVGRPFPYRLGIMVGLAALWVALEWLRGWVFTGFPWLPLAASQWERGPILQIAAYTGHYGVAFVLVFFNLGMVFYVRHLVRRKTRVPLLQRFCPEFYVAFGLLLGALTLMLEPGYFNREREPVFRAIAIQPYIKPEAKWDTELERENLAVLGFNTRLGAALEGDIILWPEAATSWPIMGVPEMQGWCEDLSRELALPILGGNMAVIGPEDDESWYNGMFLVTPEGGLQAGFYAKRHLVPYGEYVPLRRWMPFIGKFVPVAGDFSPGDSAKILLVQAGGKEWRVGSLICYEDIFPGLARDNVKAGADFHFVATNNAWYGEEAGAYQHAAHSVLRAVETRRPVIRCGNGGWSGWIDEYGAIRAVAVRPGKGVYFSGPEAFDFARDKRWAGRQSVYVRAGDWFAMLCLMLVIAGYWVARWSGDLPVETPPPDENETKKPDMFGLSLGA